MVFLEIPREERRRAQDGERITPLQDCQMGVPAHQAPGLGRKGGPQERLVVLVLRGMGKARRVFLDLLKPGQKMGVQDPGDLVGLEAEFGVMKDPDILIQHGLGSAKKDPFAFPKGIEPVGGASVQEG